MTGLPVPPKTDLGPIIERVRKVVAALHGEPTTSAEGGVSAARWATPAGGTIVLIYGARSAKLGSHNYDMKQIHDRCPSQQIEQFAIYALQVARGER